MASDPTRRAVLATAAALPLLIVGCQGTQALGTPPTPAPDAARLRQAIVAEQDLVATYQAALRQLSGGRRAPRATLAAMLGQHQEHLLQLRSRLIPGSSLAAGSGPLGRPRAITLGPGARPVPQEVLGELARAEQAASNRLLGQVPEVPSALAQLFASISASEATHVAALHAARGGLMPATAGSAGQAGQVAALQAALAAEQAAIYGYGVAGAHLAGAARATATVGWTAHQEAADQLMTELRARGATPAPAAVAYQLPHRVSTARQAVALTELLEERVTSAYLGLVALPGADLRMLGARQVRAAALRAAAWRGTTTAFPGLTAAALSRARPGAASRGRRARA